MKWHRGRGPRKPRGISSSERGSRGSRDGRAAAWGAVSGRGGQPAGPKPEQERRGPGCGAQRGERRGLGLAGSDTPTAAAALTCSSSGVSSGAMSGRGAVAGSIPPPGGQDWSASAGARALELRFCGPAPQQPSAGSRMVGPSGAARRPPRLPTPLLLAAESGLSLLRGEEMPLLCFTPFLTAPRLS